MGMMQWGRVLWQQRAHARAWATAGPWGRPPGVRSPWAPPAPLPPPHLREVLLQVLHAHEEVEGGGALQGTSSATHRTGQTQVWRHVPPNKQREERGAAPRGKTCLRLPPYTDQLARSLLDPVAAPCRPPLVLYSWPLHPPSSHSPAQVLLFLCPSTIPFLPCPSSCSFPLPGLCSPLLPCRCRCGMIMQGA